jgi:small subunit ribosomal protein S20
MANTPQAKKRIRRNANRASIHHARISRIRTFVKQVESALAAGKKKEAAEALKMAQPELARGVIHKNTASRKLSRLSKRVAALG